MEVSLGQDSGFLARLLDMPLLSTKDMGLMRIVLGYKLSKSGWFVRDSLSL